MSQARGNTPSPLRSRQALLSASILRVGILLYPAYFILDWFVYPRQKYSLLAIRIAATVYLFLAQHLFARIKEKYLYPLLLLSFFAVAFGISLMCLISGQGFDSPYFTGVLQIILVSTLFRIVSKGGYAVLVAVIVVPHFALLLLFAPWSPNGLLINVFGIVIFSALAVFAHNLFYDLARENKELKGFLPICARCKKIRDDEGYWKEVDSYITAHSDVEFSHGLCPECLRILYPEFAETQKPANGEKRKG